MASRVAKHACRPRVISHDFEWATWVLTMCAVTPCNKTESNHFAKTRVTVSNTGTRKKTRPITEEEWKARWSAIPHMCCQ